MLLIAEKEIPGTIRIVPGQQFIEQDEEQARRWVEAGMARVPAKINVNSRGWEGGLCWDGQAVVVIASGPSLTKEQCDAVMLWRSSSIGTRKVIVINTSFRRAPLADVLYACDGRWWDAVDPATNVSYHDEAAQWFRKDQMWTQERSHAEKYGIRFVQSSNGPGLSRQIGVLNQGNNGGYQAINLAYWAGAQKIFLLGFDMHGTHWHGDHPAPLRQNLPVKNWLAKFPALAADLKEKGVRVINITPNSSLKCFDMMSLEEALV